MTTRVETHSAPSQTIASVHSDKERPSRKRLVRERVVLSWSGGKDSTMAAYHLLASQKYEITALLTTVTEEFDRISMHGVRRELLEQQSESLGIPLHVVMIPKDCTNEIYEARMREALGHFQAQGITKIAFGDLFLEDVKPVSYTHLDVYKRQAAARCSAIDTIHAWTSVHALTPIWMGCGRFTRTTCSADSARLRNSPLR